MSHSNLVGESRESYIPGSHSNWLGSEGINGANSRGLLSVNSCERLALVVLCISGSPWENCSPLHIRETLDAGVSVSEYIVVESYGD
jgi:hypothetical protein